MYDDSGVTTCICQYPGTTDAFKPQVQRPPRGFAETIKFETAPNHVVSPDLKTVRDSPNTTTPGDLGSVKFPYDPGTTTGIHQVPFGCAKCDYMDRQVPPLMTRTATKHEPLPSTRKDPVDVKFRVVDPEPLRKRVRLLPWPKTRVQLPLPKTSSERMHV